MVPTAERLLFGDVVVLHTVPGATHAFEAGVSVLNSFGESDPQLSLVRVAAHDATGNCASAPDAVAGGDADPSVAPSIGADVPGIVIQRGMFALVDPAHRVPQHLAHAGGSNNAAARMVRYGRRVCLQHCDSGLFLTIMPTKQSPHDERYFMAVLVRPEHMGTGSYFKLMPRYHIHYEGDPVMNGDHVRLQLLERDVFCYAMRIEHGDSTEQLPVCGATNDSLVFHLHKVIDGVITHAGVSAISVAKELCAERAITANMAVALFHRQKESLLLTESTARANKPGAGGPSAHVGQEIIGPHHSSDDPVLETFAAFKDENSIIMANFPPCGALWILEPLDPFSPVHASVSRATAGSVHVNSELYRIRQLLTGKYLAVDGVPGRSQVAARFTALLSREVQGPDNYSSPWCAHADAKSTAMEVGEFGELRFTTVATPPRSQEADVATLFLLRRAEGVLDSNSTTVTSEQLTRIQHACTGLWVSTAITEPGRERAPVIPVEVHSRATLHDAFTIVPVSKAVAHTGAHVSSLREALQKYVEQFQHGGPQTTTFPSFAHVAERVTSALSQLVCFCTESVEMDPLKREGLPIYEHQQLLFDVHIHELLFEVIMCPFTEDLTIASDCTGGPHTAEDVSRDPQLVDVKRICCLAYRALRQMIKGSPALAARLVPWIPILQEHSGLEFGATEALLMVFQNNDSNVPRETCRRAVDHFVGALPTASAPGSYLRLLAAMCTAATGSGITPNQEDICQQLLVRVPDALLRVVQLRAGSIGVRLSADTIVLLDEFLACETLAAHHTGLLRMLDVFIAQVELFCALSIGQRVSPKVVSTIDHYISKHHMITIVNTIVSQVPGVGIASHLDDIAPHLINLASKLYIEEEQFVEGRHIGSEIGMVPECKRPTFPDDTPLVRSLKEVAFKILQTNNFLVVENTKRSQVLVSLLSFWELLVKRRHYYPTEAKQLFPILLGILDSSGDVLSPKKTRLGKEWNLYEANELNLAAMAVKEHACRVLDALLHNSIVDASMRVATALHEKYAVLLDETALPANAMKEVISMVALEAAAVAKEVSARKVVDRVHDVLRYESQSLTAIALSLVRRVSRTESEIAEHVRRFGFFQLEGITGHFFQGIRSLVQACSTLEHSLWWLHPQLNEEQAFKGLEVINYALTTGQCAWHDITTSGSSGSEQAKANFDVLHDAMLQDKHKLQTSSSLPKLTLAALERHEAMEAGEQPKPLPLPSAPQPEEPGMPVLLRAAVMQHWGISGYILSWLKFVTDARSQLFSVLVDVVYTLAAASSEAALQFAPHVLFFMDGIYQLERDGMSQARLRCNQIVLAIMSARKHAHGMVDTHLLAVLFERIQTQVKKPHPNDTFLRLFNETIVGTHMAPHNQKYVLETLHAAGAFHLCSNITDKTNQQQLEFNASLLKLIANCCIGNSVARHVAHRVLPSNTIIELLLSPLGLPTLHRARYYRLLGMLYFVFDDESPHERRQMRRAWTVHRPLWELLSTSVTTRFTNVAVRLRSREPEDQAESTLVFSSILPTLCCYFRDVFDVAGGNTVETVCSGVEQVAQAVAELAGAVFDASRKGSAAIGTKELTPLGTLLPLLRTVADELDLTSTAKQLSELVPGIEAEIQNALEGSCNESVMTGLEPDSAASHLRRIKKRLEMISKGSSTANSAELLGDAEDPRRIVVERFMRPDADAVFDKMIHSVSGERDAEGDKFCLALLDVVRATLNRAAEEGDEALERQQERFNQFGLIKIAVEVTGSKDHNLLDAAIFSCIAAVEGGNREVQDSLMEYFARHNERFFLNLKNLLSVSLMNVRRENQQAAQLQLLGPGGDPLGAKLIDMCRDRRSPMYSLRHVDSILLLLQQLCEGHHHTLQNYIRFQSDNVVSTNMPKAVLDLFSECVVTVHKANVKVITRMLAFFTEICQGPCANNQMELVRGGICVHIARLLKLTAADVECHADDFDELHAAAAVTLLALLEGNETPEIFYRVLHEVPVGLIADLMGRLREHVPQSWTEGIDEGASEDAANLLFQFLIFLKQVRPHTAAESDEREKIDEVFHEFHYLAVLLGRIEIQRGRSLERIYFKIPRVCLSLTEESREKLLWSVDRSTRHTKLSDFMTQADELIFEMEYAYNFRQRLRRLIGGEQSSKLTAVQGGAGSTMMRHAQRMWSTVASFVLVPRIEYYENMILALAVMINLFFVLSDVTLESAPQLLHHWITPAAPNATDAEFAVLPNALSPFLADLPEATSVLHFQSESPSLLVSIFDSFAPIGFNDFVKIVAMMQVVLCAMALLMDSVMGLPLHFYRMDHKRDADAAEAKKRSDTAASPHRATSSQVRGLSLKRRVWMRVSDTFLRATTVYRTLLFLASVLAVFVSPLFLCLHLVGLISRSTILMNVCRAVTLHGKSLVVTMGLGVIIVYIFSVFGLSRFPTDYSPEDEGNCSSLQRCFIFILMNGLRQGGGIGDAMKEESWTDRNHSIRMIHDFLFFSVMNIVFMNILFGIIIDTFAELRDDRQSKEEDMQTCCFVCGLKDDELEQAGISFEKHVTEDHDIFQYLFFFYHLRKKVATEYTGQETFVADMVRANDLHFFPSETCFEMNVGAVASSDADAGVGEAPTQPEKTGVRSGCASTDADAQLALRAQQDETLQLLRRISGQLAGLHSERNSSMRATGGFPKFVEAEVKNMTEQTPRVNNFACSSSSTPDARHVGEGSASLPRAPHWFQPRDSPSFPFPSHNEVSGRASREPSAHRH